MSGKKFASRVHLRNVILKLKNNITQLATPSDLFSCVTEIDVH